MLSRHRDFSHVEEKFSTTFFKDIKLLETLRYLSLQEISVVTCDNQECNIFYFLDPL